VPVPVKISFKSAPKMNPEDDVQNSNSVGEHVSEVFPSHRHADDSTTTQKPTDGTSGSQKPEPQGKNRNYPLENASRDVFRVLDCMDKFALHIDDNKYDTEKDHLLGTQSEFLHILRQCLNIARTLKIPFCDVVKEVNELNDSVSCTKSLR